MIVFLKKDILVVSLYEIDWFVVVYSLRILDQKLFNLVTDIWYNF